MLQGNAKSVCSHYFNTKWSCCCNGHVNLPVINLETRTASHAIENVCTRSNKTSHVEDNANTNPAMSSHIGMYRNTPKTVVTMHQQTMNA